MRAICAGLAVLGLMLGAAPAAAQTGYPSQTVRILVGFTAGTAPDIVARVLAERFAVSWGRPVVVENIGGAGGNIACNRVAHSAPDGHVLVMCGHRSLPITQVFVASNILVVHPSVPVSSIPELVALAKAEPGKLTYAHTGIGTSQHLAGELFKYMAHLDIRPVAYRGTTAVLPDLLAGRLSMSFSNISNVLPLVREGKLKGFAVSSVKRSGAAPDLPTMIEMGYPGFDAVPWFGLMAPAGTPKAVTDKIYAETMKVLAQPEVRKQLADLGIDLIGGTPAEFATVITTDTEKWAKLIKAMGIGVIE